jgi:two-component system chemotaxis response regulator CheB
MVSSLTERGAAATLEALWLGAADYVTKPAQAGSLEASVGRLRDELAPKIRQFFPRNAFGPEPRPIPPLRHAPAGQPRRVVAVGASTGGPGALAAVLSRLPAEIPAPVLVVQHMPPVFTRLLAERLGAQSSIAVREAQGGEALAPGRAYVAPGDYHLLLKGAAGRVETALNQNPPENSCRPSVDVLFRSAAEVYGGAVIAVVLTGMGRDGLRGVEILKSRGAFVIAQDEASSVVWGMPSYVVQAGLADDVAPLDQVGTCILRQLS